MGWVKEITYWCAEAQAERGCRGVAHRSILTALTRIPPALLIPELPA
jgi:hypothetical protein